MVHKILKKFDISTFVFSTSLVKRSRCTLKTQEVIFSNKLSSVFSAATEQALMARIQDLYICSFISLFYTIANSANIGPKLNKRNKKTAKQTKGISPTFDIDNCLFHGFTIYVNKAIQPISNQIFYRICQSVHIFHYRSFVIALNILYIVLFIVNCNEWIYFSC